MKTILVAACLALVGCGGEEFTTANAVLAVTVQGDAGDAGLLVEPVDAGAVDRMNPTPAEEAGAGTHDAGMPERDAHDEVLVEDAAEIVDAPRPPVSCVGGDASLCSTACISAPIYMITCCTSAGICGCMVNGVGGVCK